MFGARNFTAHFAIPSCIFAGLEVNAFKTFYGNNKLKCGIKVSYVIKTMESFAAHLQLRLDPIGSF